MRGLIESSEVEGEPSSMKFCLMMRMRQKIGSLEFFDKIQTQGLIQKN